MYIGDSGVAYYIIRPASTETPQNWPTLRFQIYYNGWYQTMLSPVNTGSFPPLNMNDFFDNSTSWSGGVGVITGRTENKDKIVESKLTYMKGDTTYRWCNDTYAGWIWNVSVESTPTAAGILLFRFKLDSGSGKARLQHVIYWPSSLEPDWVEALYSLSFNGDGYFHVKRNVFVWLYSW